MIREKYNQIADVYDTLFLDEYSRFENDHIRTRLEKESAGTLLDIGCGTGLLIDILPNIKPERYTGIDPSEKMLERFIQKHPRFRDRLLNVRFENFSSGKYDLIVALFGVPNYIKPGYLQQVTHYLAARGKYFLMFYKHGYYPATYEKTNLEVPHFKLSKRVLDSLFPNVVEFNNYLIAENL